MSMLLKEAKQTGSPFSIYVKGNDKNSKEKAREVNGLRDASVDASDYDGFVSHRQKGYVSRHASSTDEMSPEIRKIKLQVKD